MPDQQVRASTLADNDSIPISFRSASDLQNVLSCFDVASCSVVLLAVFASSSPWIPSVFSDNKHSVSLFDQSSYLYKRRAHKGLLLLLQLPFSAQQPLPLPPNTAELQQHKEGTTQLWPHQHLQEHRQLRR